MKKTQTLDKRNVFLCAFVAAVGLALTAWAGGTYAPQGPGSVNSGAFDNVFGSTQGQVLHRNATEWTALAVGTNGQLLTSGGAAADASWTTGSGNVVDTLQATVDAGATTTTALTASGANVLGATGVLTQVLGTLNVDEAVTLDTTLVVTGLATLNGGAQFPDSVNAIFGTGSDSAITFLATQTTDSLALQADAAGQTVLLIQQGDGGFDFAHAVQINPTLFIHSANQSTTQWLSLQHDTAGARIETGLGAINLVTPLGRVEFTRGAALEVYFGSSRFNLLDNIPLALGTSVDARLQWVTALDNDALVLALRGGGPNGGGAFLLVNLADPTGNYAHAAFDDPHLIVHSRTPSATATDEYISLFHDVTDARINWGSGDLALGATAGGQAVRFEGTTDVTILDGDIGCVDVAATGQVEVNNSSNRPLVVRGATTAFNGADAAIADLGGLLLRSADIAGTGTHVDIVATGTDTGNFPSEMRFWTRPSSGDPTLRMTISDVGNVRIGGTAGRPTEGSAQLVLFNGTAPAGTLANGVSFYSASGEANVMDAAGNATLLSPHDADGDWIFRSANGVTGRGLRVRMERLVKALERDLGYGVTETFSDGKWVAYEAEGRLLRRLVALEAANDALSARLDRLEAR